MCDGIMLTIGDDGVAREYDDTYDIVIHCESQEDQDKAREKLTRTKWIPCSERLPEDKQECLITAKALNMFCIDLARFGTDLYSVDKYDFHDRKGKSGWYYFDPDLGYVELPDVVAWMPLPEPYREVES